MLLFNLKDSYYIHIFEISKFTIIYSSVLMHHTRETITTDQLSFELFIY